MRKIAFLCMISLTKMANSVQSYNFLLIFTHFIRKNQLCKHKKWLYTNLSVAENLKK